MRTPDPTIVPAFVVDVFEPFKFLGISIPLIRGKFIETIGEYVCMVAIDSDGSVSPGEALTEADAVSLAYQKRLEGYRTSIRQFTI